MSMQSRIDVAQNCEDTADNDYWDEIKFVSMKKEELWKHLRPELYTIFWYMNIQNLIVPEKLYKELIKSIADELQNMIGHGHIYNAVLVPGSLC